MILNKKNLEKMENKNLAPYAVKSLHTAGREFAEPVDTTRTEFQRDRDRIMHSKAFRRLSGKTQVFVATYGDHFRDRLTHSLEVAQVARGLARNLGINEDLCEAIALAHDLGHTPFGHAGEYTLDAIMSHFGDHFEHNEQSKRIVEMLEKQFPDFDGLNLTWETRDGLAKHQTLYDQKTKKIRGKTLEAQVVDLADEIAYHNHDLDDGLRSELFTEKDLAKLALWKQASQDIAKKYGTRINPLVRPARIISRIISLMITDVCEQTERAIKNKKIKTLKDVMAEPKNLVSFSPKFGMKVAQLRDFLWDNMYQSAKIKKLTKKGQHILQAVFIGFYENPKLMPKRFYERIDVTDPLHVVVKDYVSGMTDEYATQIYEASL